jgi:hypothetical protein
MKSTPEQVTDKLRRLALKLADECATVSFRSNCYPRQLVTDGTRGCIWFALPSPHLRDRHLRQVLQYLKLRGMLKRHATDRGLWRVVKAARGQR